MSVRFDLRPEKYRGKAQKRQTGRSALLFIVLFVASFGLSVGNALFGYFRLDSLRNEAASVSERMFSLERQAKELDRELQRLQQQEQLHAKVLSMVREDIPSLEFLVALEASLPGTVWVDRISIHPGRAEVEGYAYSEGDVVVFGNALSRATVVREVSLPVTNGVVRDGRRLVRFSLSCSLADLASLGDASGGK
jgi:Tfp pilus assembly protein PilN